MKKNFKLYGILGIFFIAFTQLNFILKIEPFARWYFPIIWFGYILAIDALVNKIKGKSLLVNKPSHFLKISAASVLFWVIFEIINFKTQNWLYSGTELFSPTEKIIFGLLSFATVLPALFETTDLILAVRLFDKEKLKRSHNISKNLIFIMILIGMVSFILPFIYPKYTFPLIWVSFFFLLDPINYIHNRPSIIKHLKDRKLAIPLSLLLAGIILGFLWEFWNYWAITKWSYEIPFFGFFKIFEMPLLGYLGYLPFVFELYAMYWFVMSFFGVKK